MPDIDKVISMSKIFGVTTDCLLIDEDISQTEDSSSNENHTDTSSAPTDCSDSDRFVKIKLPRFEYKSKKTLGGLPLVHVKLNGRAKGIFAIGLMATGVISVGLLSIGLLSLGLLSLGLIALGTVSFGALSFGAISCGILAFGGIALGIFTVGGLSVGMYSLGGCAIASKIAFGGYANGYIAIGDKVNGEYTWCIKQGFSPEMRKEVYQTILRELPNTPRFIINFFK